MLMNRIGVKRSSYIISAGITPHIIIALSLLSTLTVKMTVTKTAGKVPTVLSLSTELD